VIIRVSPYIPAYHSEKQMSRRFISTQPSTHPSFKALAAVAVLAVSSTISSPSAADSPAGCFQTCLQDIQTIALNHPDKCATSQATSTMLSNAGRVNVTSAAASAAIPPYGFAYAHIILPDHARPDPQHHFPGSCLTYLPWSGPPRHCGLTPAETSDAFSTMFSYCTQAGH
jgi:hypothetical protein